MTRAIDRESSEFVRFEPPTPAEGLVLRPTVVTSLSAPSVSVAVITAPGGYGKSSHAAAWVDCDPRPVAWLDLEEAHDDPSVLLDDLVAALSSVTDLAVDGLAARGASPSQYTIRVVAVLGRALRRCTVPFVLVLDDVHRIADPSSTDLLGALVSHVPPGSTVVLLGRMCPLQHLARLRVQSKVAEIGVDDLALDEADVAAVLTGLGIPADPGRVQKITATTEGWPVGVRLAALSDRDAGLLDYVREEWLGGVAPDDRDFLERASALDWLSGPLCNAVLDRQDAGDVLHRIFSDRLLVIPLDRREHSYRMHGLLRDALSAELERHDAAAAREVHRRASAWFEAAGDPDRAVRHAMAADDVDRAEQVVVANTPVYYATGRHTTLKRWVESIPREQVLRSPGLCLTAALASLGLGEQSSLAVWLRLGEQAVTAAPDSDPMYRLCLLDLRSTTNVGPVRPALDDAAAAYHGLPPGIWHAAACLAYGMWLWTVGDDRGVEVLHAGADEAVVLGGPAIEAYCAAMLALIAFSEGDQARAQPLVRRAHDVVAANGLEGEPGIAVVSASAALGAACSGDAQSALREWQLARSQLARVSDMSGWANVQTRIALANTSLLLGDRIGAETMLREAHDFLVRQPDATRAHAQVAKLDELVRHLRYHSSIGSSSLTTAELRVLHYLPTHLSLGEVAARLYVSRYTVKTHCESVYRKLNVGSRSEAVDAARRLGLLTDADFIDDV